MGRRRLSKHVRPVQEERDLCVGVQIPKGREVVFFATRDFKRASSSSNHHHCDDDDDDSMMAVSEDDDASSSAEEEEDATHTATEKTTRSRRTKRIPPPRRIAGASYSSSETTTTTTKVIPRPRQGRRGRRAPSSSRSSLVSSSSSSSTGSDNLPPTPPPSPKGPSLEEEKDEKKLEEETTTTTTLTTTYVPPPPPLPPPPPMPPSPPSALPPPPPVPDMLTMTRQHENAHHYAAAMSASFADMHLSSHQYTGHSYRDQHYQGGKERVEPEKHMQPPPNKPRPPNQHWSLDYSSNYVVTGERPQNFIIDPQGIPTPALQKLVDLKSELISAHAHVPLSVKIESAKRCELTSEKLGTFDVVVINPDWSKMTWRDVARLDLNAVTSEKAFVFMWIGKGDGKMHDNALKIIKAWKFRRCAEEIVWVKTGLDNVESPYSSPPSSLSSKKSAASRSAGAVGSVSPKSSSSKTTATSSPSSPSSPSTPSTLSTPSSVSSYSSPSSFRSRSTSIASTVTHLSTLSEDEGGINEEDFPLALHKEHCIIAVKAKVTRKEAQLIHANVDADVIISPPLHGNKKPDQIYGIAERFVQGLRRLNLFGDTEQLRPGWVTVSENVDRTTHNPFTYRKAFEGTRLTGKFEAQYQRRANRAMSAPPTFHPEMQQQQQYSHDNDNQYQSPHLSTPPPPPQEQQQQQRQLRSGGQTYTYRHKSGLSPQSSPQRVSRPAHLLPHDEDITRLRPKSRSPSKSGGRNGSDGGGQFSSYDESEYAADEYYSPRTPSQGAVMVPPMFSQYAPPPTFYPQQQYQYPYVSQQYIHALQQQQQQYQMSSNNEQQQQQQQYYKGTFTLPPGSSGPA